MNLLTASPAQPWLNLVPVLLHTLWQAALIALLLGVCLTWIPAARTRLRYSLAVLSLAAVLGCGFLTLALIEHRSIPADETSLAVSPATASTSTSPSPRTAAPDLTEAPLPVTATKSAFSRPSTDARAVVLGLWLTGVFAMLGRLGLSLHDADRLRRACHPCKEGPALHALVDVGQRAARTEQRIRLLLADHLETPAAMGVFWPVIILPAHLATGTPPATLRALLAHELAHIRRHDYLVNLGQLLIETLLFRWPVR